MVIESMTGFARCEVLTHNGARLTCEIRSVNAKTLDVRLRLPVNMDRLEIPLRQLVQKRMARGSLQISILCQEAEKIHKIQINEPLVHSLLSAAKRLNEQYHLAMPTIGELLGMRGVIDNAMQEPEQGLDSAVSQLLDNAITILKQSRAQEGAKLVGFLRVHLEKIARLVDAANADPSCTPAAIRAKLSAQVALLLDASQSLDEPRIAMEAALLATKADIREELDRLQGHISTALSLLTDEGSVGRKLDFLAQEFNREVNTLCAKSNSSTITSLGLELKAVVDQLREQVQNLE